MTDNINQLAKWLDAAKVAFKMGTRNPHPEIAIIVGIYHRLRTRIEEAEKAGVDTSVVSQELQEFLDELAAELPMYDLIRKRFNPEIYPGHTCREDVKIYVAMMAETPGSAVMAMTFLHLVRCYDTKDMVTNFIPSGYPASDALGLTWSIQKMPNGTNAVDHINSVNSLYNNMYNSGDK